MQPRQRIRSETDLHPDSGPGQASKTALPGLAILRQRPPACLEAEFHTCSEACSEGSSGKPSPGHRPRVDELGTVRWPSKERILAVTN